MKPSYAFARRFLIATFSSYYALFSCSALAAGTTKKAVSKKPSQKVEIPQASPAAIKQYQSSLRWALSDVDLFPSSVTKFSGNVGSINTLPTVPGSSIGTTNTIDPFPPLPPTGGGGFPAPGGGGFPSPGGGFPPTFPGSTFPQNQMTMTTAPVPAEFACPLFENNPYESIFRALDSMRQSIPGIKEECLPKPETDQVMSSSDRLRDSINYLKYFQSNPEQIASANTKDIENAIAGAMTAVNQISTNLNANKRCGNYTSSFNRTLMAFNEVVSNLAPIALMAAAFNPAITPTAQGAIFATTVASKTAATFWETFFNSGIDIDNDDHRKAVLQNTCQYLKIAQKITFLNYKTKEQVQDLTKNLSYKVKEYQTRYQSTTPTLLPLLKYRYNSEKMFAEIETALSQDRLNLKYHSTTIAGLKDDHERICARGAMLAKVGSLPDNSSLSTFGGFGGFGMTTTLAAFPLSLVSNLDRVTEALQQSSNSMFPSFPSFGSNPFGVTPSPLLPPTPTPPPGDPSLPPADAKPEDPANAANGNIDPFNPNPGISLPPTNEQAVDEAELLFQAFKTSRNRVVSLSERAKSDARAIKACSDETTLWLKRMSDLMEYTANLANKERSGILGELEKNEEYRVWAIQYEKLRSERRTLDPIIRVLDAMSGKNATSVSGELNIRLNKLRRSLFEKSWKIGQSPVEAWLNYNIIGHEKTLGRYMHSVNVLQKVAYEYTGSAQKTFWGRLNPQADKDNEDTLSLKSITLQTAQIGTPFHRMTCQNINNSLRLFNDAKISLNFAEFMCDMIDEVIANTSPEIIKICRGSEVFNKKGVRSQIEVQRDRLNRKNEISKKFSMEEFNSILEKKAESLQCPPPNSPLTAL